MAKIFEQLMEGLKKSKEERERKNKQEQLKKNEEAEAERNKKIRFKINETKKFGYRILPKLKKIDKTEFKRLKEKAETFTDDDNYVEQFDLGRCYANEIFLKKDLEKSFVWFMTAAKAGYPPAQYNLAYLYLYGEGVPPHPDNHKEAFKWFNEAANREYVIAHNIIGTCYLKSMGVDPASNNIILAYLAFREGEKLGDSETTKGIETCIKYFDLYGISLFDVEPSLPSHSQEESSKNTKTENNKKFEYREVEKFKNLDEFNKMQSEALSDEKDDAEAKFCLANCYLKGVNVKKNPKIAAYFFKEAIKLGFAPAHDELGSLYSDFAKFKKEPQKQTEYLKGAFQEYSKAAKLGYAIAQYHLALCYKNGHGIAQNPEFAFTWFMKAAVGGNMSAEKEVIWCIENQSGLPKDLQNSKRKSIIPNPSKREKENQDKTRTEKQEKTKTKHKEAKQTKKTSEIENMSKTTALRIYPSSKKRRNAVLTDSVNKRNVTPPLLNEEAAIEPPKKKIKLSPFPNSNEFSC